MLCSVKFQFFITTFFEQVLCPVPISDITGRGGGGGGGGGGVGW